MRLRERLSNAHQAYMDAMSRFDEAAQRPGEDGPLRVQQAGRELNAAYLQYMEALEQSNAFATSGAVPDDLFPPE